MSMSPADRGAAPAETQQPAIVSTPGKSDSGAGLGTSSSVHGGSASSQAISVRSENCDSKTSSSTSTVPSRRHQQYAMDAVGSTSSNSNNNKKKAQHETDAFFGALEGEMSSSTERKTGSKPLASGNNNGKSSSGTAKKNFVATSAAGDEEMVVNKTKSNDEEEEGVDEQQHPVHPQQLSALDEVRLWRDDKVAQVPCVLRPVYRFFIATVLPNDSFDIAVRKMLLAGSWMMVPFSLGLGINWLIQASQYQAAENPDQQLAHASGLVAGDEHSRLVWTQTALTLAGVSALTHMCAVVTGQCINKFYYKLDEAGVNRSVEEAEAARQSAKSDDEEDDDDEAAGANNNSNNNNNNNNNNNTISEKKKPGGSSESQELIASKAYSDQQQQQQQQQQLQLQQLQHDKNSSGKPRTNSSDDSARGHSSTSSGSGGDGQFPFWLTDFILTSAIIFVCAMTVTIPHFPVPTNMLAILQMSVVVRSDWFVLHAALASLGFLVATYNMTFLNFGDWELLSISNYHGSTAENLLLSVAGWVAILITSYSLYAHYSEFLRLVHKSSTTTKMGSSVATHLRQWDLKGVERALISYHAQPHSDNFLHTQFTNIVQTIRDFSVYLPRDIISSLVQAGESLRDSRLRLREVTLLWIEVANFPALCDTVPCDELAKLLRWFHEAMARVVRQHGGVVVRLGGNMLCGMWNAPMLQENAACRACLAALHAVAVTEDALVSKFEDEGFGLQIRAGVHSGTAMVGPLGSCDRASYTANGGAVHFAAAMAKFGKRMRRSSIMVSDTTVREANAQLAAMEGGGMSMASGRFVTREAAEARAARHTTTTVVHQLIGVTPETEDTLRQFHERNVLRQQQLGSGDGVALAVSGGVLSLASLSESDDKNQQQPQQQKEDGGGENMSDSLDHSNSAKTSPGNSSVDDSMPLVGCSSLLPILLPDVVRRLFAVDSVGLSILAQLDEARKCFDERDFVKACGMYRAMLALYDGAAAATTGGRTPPSTSVPSSSSSNNMMMMANEESFISPSSSSLSSAPSKWPRVLVMQGVDEQMVDSLFKAAERLSRSNAARFDPVVVFYDE